MTMKEKYCSYCGADVTAELFALGIMAIEPDGKIRCKECIRATQPPPDPTRIAAQIAALAALHAALTAHFGMNLLSANAALTDLADNDLVWHQTVAEMEACQEWLTSLAVE